MPSPAKPVPSLLFMNAAFVLAGLATFLLGPILPILIAQWHLTDQQAGLLLLAQFTGATLGGATVSRRLPQAFRSGLTAAFVGFLFFGFAHSLLTACLGLMLGGLGVGRIIASVNIIAGARFATHTGSALARLNISFSLGCLLSPLLAASLTTRVALPQLLVALAVCSFVLSLLVFLELDTAPIPEASAAPAPVSILNIPFFLFVAILFFYGGLETCLSAWLTTFALRYGHTSGQPASLVLSQYTLVLLLCGLTAGRALATWLLKTIPEVTLLRIALVLTIAMAAALALAHSALVLAAEAILLGVCLAPIFPAAFALYMARKPSARQAALVLAASGLGAAAIPWLMGVVSTHAHSLRLALTLPVAAALTLLAISAVAGQQEAHATQ
jgi:FHS family glucose/mannose:H+ symporter-like MFS transporter